MYGDSSNLSDLPRGLESEQSTTGTDSPRSPSSAERTTPSWGLSRRAFALFALAVLLGFVCSDQIPAFPSPRSGQDTEALDVNGRADVAPHEESWEAGLSASRSASSERAHSSAEGPSPEVSPSPAATPADPSIDEPIASQGGEEVPASTTPVAATIEASTDADAEDEAELQRFEATHAAMGVKFTIIGYAAEEAVARQAVGAAFERIDELNDILSDYDPESESMRLCREENVATWQSVSPDLHAMLARGAEFSAATDGAFDVTVGPLTKLWRQSRRTGELPGEAELQERLERVGYGLIDLRDESHEVRITRAGMGLDFGGIAQGFAADEAAKLLARHGINRCLIDASGDVLALDSPPDRDAWNIAIAPLEQGGEGSVTVSLKNHSISTSGDAFQFVEIGGRRFSHIIDPRTGWPVEGRSSVTVLSADATTADALASALSIMEPEAAMAWVEEHDGIEAYIVRIVDGEPRVLSSGGFARFIAGGSDE